MHEPLNPPLLCRPRHVIRPDGVHPPHQLRGAVERHDDPGQVVNGGDAANGIRQARGVGDIAKPDVELCGDGVQGPKGFAGPLEYRDTFTGGDQRVGQRRAEASRCPSDEHRAAHGRPFS